MNRILRRPPRPGTNCPNYGLIWRQSGRIRVWMKKKKWCGCRPSCLVPAGEKPKRMETDHPKTGKEPNNVRLCSPMFAYVRLIGKKCLRPGVSTKKNPAPTKSDQPRSNPTKSNQIRPNIPRDVEWWKTGWFQMSHCETFDIPLRRRRLRRCARPPENARCMI